MFKQFAQRLGATPIQRILAAFAAARQHRQLGALSPKLEPANSTDQMTGLLNRQAFLTRRR